MNLERDFTKRFLTTYAIKTAVSLLSFLRRKHEKKSLVSSLVAILFDSSNARFALSISSFSYLYHRIKEKLAGLFPDSSENRCNSSVRYFLAGNRFIALYTEL